jgi:hypothetical protein
LAAAATSILSEQGHSSDFVDTCCSDTPPEL